MFVFNWARPPESVVGARVEEEEDFQFPLFAGVRDKSRR